MGFPSVSVPHPETLINRGRVFAQTDTLATLQGLGTVAADIRVETKGRISAGIGGGKYISRVGDYSAQVAADEVTLGEGDGAEWIAFGDDKTGASGAWELVGQDQPEFAQYGEYLPQLSKMRGGEPFSVGRAMSKSDYAAARAEENTDDQYALLNNIMGDASRLIIPEGKFYTSGVVSYQRVGQQIEGAGVESSKLVGTSETGAVLRMNDFFQKLKGITIDADATRMAATLGTNFGLLVEPADSDGAEAKMVDVSQILVRNQPGHGIGWVAGYYGGTLNNFKVERCGGHGFIGDNGTVTGRTYKRRLGGVDIKNGVIQDCVGHSVAIGAYGEDDNHAYRIKLFNVDQFRCALAAGVRKEVTCAYLVGENIDIELNAFNGYTYDPVPYIGQGARTVSCLTVGGRSINIDNNRFIDPSSYCVRVVDDAELSNRDINVGTFRLGLSAGDPIAIAILDASVNRLAVKVKNQDYFNFDKLKSSDTFVLADNTAMYIRFSDTVHGVITLGANVADRGSAVAHFRTGDANAFVNILSSTGPTVTGSVGAHSGTTGVDGQLTIAGRTDAAYLYIENRTGGSGSYTLEFDTKTEYVAEDVIFV
ncbi:hypothetical protein [Zhongshania sp. BJYM1]|uniref:hypothetical protein n=1 Tax=Zhongshania aquatica TaxID=2965069 RepID=UPI0022B5B529|nr:hypothetical protein [Marortus sp. BJYM1]